WFYGHRNCNSTTTDQQFFSTNTCGTKAAPVAMTGTFNFGAGSGATPHAKVTWADGATTGAKGGVKVALTNLTVPTANTPVTACAPNAACANSSTGNCNNLKLGLKTVKFLDLTLRTDDSSVAYTGVSPRYLDSDGLPGADTATVLAGPWFIDTLMELYHQEPGSTACGALKYQYSKFVSSALTGNPLDRKWAGGCVVGGTGVYACVTGTAPSRKLDIYINLPDVTMDAQSCAFDDGYLGGIWIDVGLKSFTGELHFTE
ncbi:MAG: hypothetical protein HY906_20160, partial [Deltaproteobacteria bacterium]|nr:hypothetical protein [Deltaproteobacteria bacterium]